MTFEQIANAFSSAAKDGRSLTFGPAELDDIADVIEELSRAVQQIENALPSAGDSHSLHRAYDIIDGVKETFRGETVMALLEQDSNRLWDDMQKLGQWEDYERLLAEDKTYTVSQYMEKNENSRQRYALLAAMKAAVLANRAESAELQRRCEGTAVILCWLLEQKLAQPGASVDRDTDFAGLYNAKGEKLTFFEAATMVSHLADIPKWEKVQL